LPQNKVPDGRWDARRGVRSGNAEGRGGWARMMRIATLYGTGEGQTAVISERMMQSMRDLGHEAEAMDVRNLPGALDDYDGVIVGASIHMGEHDRHITDFVRRHREALEQAPSAFCSVSLTARDRTEKAS